LHIRSYYSNMQRLINRMALKQVKQDLNLFPAVAVLGPRQCGKTTLAQMIGSENPHFSHLDLERPSDLRKLDDPELFFKHHQQDLVCLDEVQNRPDLFPVLRAIIDERKRPGQLIILGSANGNLLQQSAESLAGRISYVELTPFIAKELLEENCYEIKKHWMRGGYPKSYLAENDVNSFHWREVFVRTLIERDFALLGIGISSKNLQRFIMMIAHLHGQVFNASRIGESIGVSYHTARSYLDIFENTYLIRTLPPFTRNVKKRIIKSPKVYIRDSGVFHALLNMKSFDDLLGHPSFGLSWEGYCIENILCTYPEWDYSFYRTASGNEVDLVCTDYRQTIAIECKAATAPRPGRGFWQALEDISADRAWIVAPVEDSYPIADKVSVCSLKTILDEGFV